MTNDLDPRLASLFQSAEEEFPDEVFTSQVMSAVESQRRRSIIGWTLSGLVLVSLAWILVLFLQDAAMLLQQFLPSSIIEVNSRWAAQFLAPVNSVSGLFGLAALGLWTAFRKLF